MLKKVNSRHPYMHNLNSIICAIYMCFMVYLSLFIPIYPSTNPNLVRGCIS